MSSSVTIHVWDLPLRLFHWLLVLTVAFSIVSGELGGNLIDWHGRAGVLVLGLLVFRIVWGFIGTVHARFSSFFPTPARVWAYLKGQWQGYGHNPLGALSVIALLAVLAGVVGTGLFANDDIAFHGPLFDLVSKDLSDRLSGWHARLFNILAGLVILHVAAIVFYARVKKHNLVVPMLTGKKEIPGNEAPAAPSVPAFRVAAPRFLAALLVSGVVVWGVGSGAQRFAAHSAPAAPVAAKPDW